jgi:hypothetical protein
VWVVAYERAEREGRVPDLLLLQRPVDHRRSGQSAWISYWRGDDESLWAAPDTLAPDTLAPGTLAPGTPAPAATAGECE